MLNYSEVIGLPVICADNGKEVGNVNDICFYDGTIEIRALLINHGLLNQSRKVILIKYLSNIGKDALIIDKMSCMKNFRSLGKNNITGGEKIIGLKIYSKTGKNLGIVKDVLLNFKTRMIEGIKVSDGLVQDIMEGRNIVPLFGKFEFGKENIVVDNEAIEEIITTGGLKNRFLNPERKE